MLRSFGGTDSQFEEKIPIKRLGQAEEVASLVAFLLGSESKYITGSAYVIDGGLMA